MKQFLILYLSFFITSVVYSQKDPKPKEIQFQFVYENKPFIGTYVGTVEKVIIDGKKRKGPNGTGFFKGKFEANNSLDVWVFYNGNWLNGEFDGEGVLWFINSEKGEEPIYGNPNDPWDPDHEQTGTLTHVYRGNFHHNKPSETDVFSIETQSHNYNGYIKNWLPNGNGQLEFNDTIYLASKPFLTKSFKGSFINGQLGFGLMTLINNEVLNGNWSNKMYTGKGKIELLTNIIYDGDWLNGNMHGNGKITKKNNFDFIGTFKDNAPDGECKMTKADGTQQIGNWIGILSNSDIIFETTGIHKIISPSGLTRIGHFDNGNFIGSGAFRLNNGEIYNGTMTIGLHNGKILSGEGKLTFINKDTLHIIWDKVGYIGFGRRNFGLSEDGDSLFEEGTFRNGLLQGQGRKGFLYKTPYLFVSDPDDDFEPYVIYSGSFNQGILNGRGIMSSTSDFYGNYSFEIDGEWKDNEPIFGELNQSLLQFDENMIREENNTYYSGTFKNRVPDGVGKFIYNDGSIYEGEVQNGEPNGKGKKTMKNKKMLSGNFVNGEYQKAP